MYNVSSKFKAAIKNGNEQYCLLDYGTTFFTAEDVDIEEGINFQEPFNPDTDLVMGQCPSATLSYSLFNDTGLLNDFEFGQHKALLGVRIATDDYTASGLAAYWYGHYFEWYDGKLYYNGEKSSYGFSGTPGLLLINNNVLYGLSTEGNLGALTVSSSGSVSPATIPTLNNFMKDKLTHYLNCGITRLNNTVYYCHDGKMDTIQYAPLGVFIAERPKVVNKKQISISCKDKMSLFDVELPEFEYPITLYDMLKQICNYVGVSMIYSSMTINKTLSIEKKPADFKTATCRDALGWIAEACCSYVRFNRNGSLQFAWFKQTTLTLDESNYSSNEEYWYGTPVIDKLVVRDSDKSDDTVVGTGDNGYIIENNPLLA